MNGCSRDLTRWCLGVATVTALRLSPDFRARPRSPSARPRIAVLPLENSSGDAAQDFFAEAMTDEIASALTGVRGLDVVARSSAFALKMPKNDSKAVGEALNASYLVKGAARHDGRPRALDVSVVRSGDGAELFSQDYDAGASRHFRP